MMRITAVQDILELHHVVNVSAPYQYIFDFNVTCRWVSISAINLKIYDTGSVLHAVGLAIMAEVRLLTNVLTIYNYQ